MVGIGKEGEVVVVLELLLLLLLQGLCKRMLVKDRESAPSQKKTKLMERTRTGGRTWKGGRRGPARARPNK